jgi:methylene-fatty-acyl-phospholipid synthase
MVAGSAVLLSVERLGYAWIARHPAAFSEATARWFRDPVDAVGVIFLACKLLQLGVFAWWCYVFGDGRLWPGSRGVVVTAAAAALLLVGQTLNLAAFYRLGARGVFYGSQFRRVLPRARAFPYSWLAHPQYVGTVLSIWAFFLFMRFPHADWMVLPALETVYYAIGARLEPR